MGVPFMASTPARFAIPDYGAVPDGKTVNSPAIQRAIDAAENAGGGIVVVPAGTFRTGSIFLKPGVELLFEEGGVLLGSEQIEDYLKRETRIEGHFEPWRMALLNAQGMDRVRITGPGTLDGSGEVYWNAYWQRRKVSPDCTNLEVERPRLVFIDSCRDVRVEGLTLQNSGFWNFHLYHCRDVVIEGLRISSPQNKAASTDGIDIDSCQDVTVRGCHISVDDDCIALKGSKGPLAHLDESSPPVENILVEDCIFGPGHGVLTCGSEATVVRNVTVRNVRVTGRNSVVRLKLRPDTRQLYENLLFENITLEGDGGHLFEAARWTQFFDLQGQAPPASIVRNVTVRNVTGTFGSLGILQASQLRSWQATNAEYSGPAGKLPDNTISGLTLEDIDLQLEDPAFDLGEVSDFQVRNVRINGEPFTPAGLP